MSSPSFACTIVAGPAPAAADRLENTDCAIINLEERNGTNVEIPTSQGSATFTLFPKLPLEIRIKIWRAAIKEPRIFVVNSRKDGRDPLRGLRYAIFDVSHEAREEVRKERSQRDESNPKLYINSDIDVLYLRDPKVSSRQFLYGEFKNFRTIAIDLDAWRYIWIPETICRFYDIEDEYDEEQTEPFRPRHLMENCKAISEVLIVVNKPDIAQHEVPVFIDPRNPPSEPVSCFSRRFEIATWMIASHGEEAYMRNLKPVAHRVLSNLARHFPPDTLETICDERGIIRPNEWKVPKIRFVDAITSREAEKLKTTSDEVAD